MYAIRSYYDIDLKHFSRTEKGRLKLALEGVDTFQEFLSLRFSSYNFV